MTREAVHFTITEAHPFHGPNGEVVFRVECPKCREALERIVQRDKEARTRRD